MSESNSLSSPSASAHTKTMNTPSTPSTPSSHSTLTVRPDSTKSSKDIQRQKEKEKRQEQMRELQVELESLKAELGDDQDPKEIVQTHIELLHQYNEIKDGTQALIGKYAQITGRTVKDIHIEMGLPLVD